jgi:hypothetical protein
MPGGQGLTDADRVVLQIINDDEEMDEHISAMHLINHFKSYEASLTKYQVSEDELFEKLSIKNKKIENYSMSSGNNSSS